MIRALAGTFNRLFHSTTVKKATSGVAGMSADTVRDAQAAAVRDIVAQGTSDSPIFERGGGAFRALAFLPRV
jgi:hypothetical protein